MADGLLQRYVDEAGNTVALEEFEPNREPWKFAQVLPSIPENYQCLACAQVFQQHPGPAVECLRTAPNHDTCRAPTWSTMRPDGTTAARRGGHARLIARSTTRSATW